MMREYLGGNKVGKGIYYNLSDGQAVCFRSGGVLPGDSKARYMKVSGPVMLALAPILTLMYILLLPVTYLATVTALLGYKLMRILVGLGGGHVYR